MSECYLFYGNVLQRLWHRAFGCPPAIAMPMSVGARYRVHCRQCGLVRYGGGLVWFETGTA